MLAGELKAIRALAGQPRAAVAPHLDGVPDCLHKYEPLLRRAWDERQASAAGPG